MSGCTFFPFLWLGCMVSIGDALCNVSYLGSLFVGLRAVMYSLLTFVVHLWKFTFLCKRAVPCFFVVLLVHFGLCVVLGLSFGAVFVYLTPFLHPLGLGTFGAFSFSGVSLSSLSFLGSLLSSRGCLWCPRHSAPTALRGWLVVFLDLCFFVMSLVVSCFSRRGGLASSLALSFLSCLAFLMVRFRLRMASF